MRANRLGRAVLASVTVEAPPWLDPASCAFSSRTAAERYFAWEQPDRDRFAIGGIGSALTVGGDLGPERFERAARRCSELLRDAVYEPGLDQPASGPIWVGGFAFADEPGTDPQWSSLPPTLLVLPAISIARRGERTTVTANQTCRPGDDPEALASACEGRLRVLRSDPIPLVDPDPLGGYELSSTLPPEEYVRAVGRAREAIARGDLEKVVLAREVRVSARTPFRSASIFDGLRTAYPSCFVYCVGTPDAAFVGASPELLVRREGAGASSVALAGSMRRSADPAVDDHLGQRLLQSAKDRVEHQIVAERIERALAPLSVWVAAAEEPSLVRVANIQHLATPVRAQLAEPRSAVDLAGVLHPTPAVGGEPWERAREAIRRLERMDRGWYAGPVGWMDAAEDGEFCVGLRCALLEGRTAHCYAGVGVVADSDPEAELEETEVKLQAVLPALTGM